MEDKFVVAIDLIAEKLGIAVTEIFDIFVTAQVIIGMMEIIKCIIVILLCIMTYFVTVKLMSGYYNPYKAMKDINGHDTTDLIAMPLLITVIFGFVWTCIVNTVSAGLLKILCPEYTAITEIIRMMI